MALRTGVRQRPSASLLSLSCYLHAHSCCNMTVIVETHYCNRDGVSLRHPHLRSVRCLLTKPATAIFSATTMTIDNEIMQVRSMRRRILGLRSVRIHECTLNE